MPTGDWLELLLDTRVNQGSRNATDQPVAVSISFLHSYQV